LYEQEGLSRKLPRHGLHQHFVIFGVVLVFGAAFIEESQGLHSIYGDASSACEVVDPFMRLKNDWFPYLRIAIPLQRLIEPNLINDKHHLIWILDRCEKFFDVENLLQDFVTGLPWTSLGDPLVAVS